MPTLTWTGPDGGDVSLTLDATPSYSAEDTTTLTDHAVESGINVTDHAKDEPTFFTLEGLVSNVPMPGQSGTEDANTPIEYDTRPDPGTQTIELEVATPPVNVSPSGLLQAGIGAVKRAVSGKPKGTFRGKSVVRREFSQARTLQHGTQRNRPKEVYDILLEARAQKVLVTVHTPERTIPNLMFQRIAAPKSVQYGTALFFQIDLREIRVADSETVDAPTPIEARGAKRRNAGAQAVTAKGGSENEAAQMESTLSKIF